MNMGGAGAKMIRGIMKKKGISSLEELIESAKMRDMNWLPLSDVVDYP